MYKTKHIVITVISGLICAGILAIAVSKIIANHPGTTQNGPVTLTMVGYTYTTQQMQPLIASYEQQHPKVTITYTQVAQSEYRNYLIQRFHAQDPKVIPEIFEAANGDTNAFLRYMHAAPETIITGTVFKEKYYPLYTRGLLYHNTYVLGLPENMDPLLLLYNKDIFTKLRLNPATLTGDFNTFNTTVAKLARNDPAFPILNVGNPNNITDAGDILELFMLENQTQMNDTNDPAKATFNNVRGLEALKYYNELGGGDYNDNWSSVNTENDLNMFAKGKLLMIFAYPSQVAQVKQTNPNLHIGYAIYPSLLSPVDLAHYNFLTAYSNTQNNTEAWNFINYTTSQQALQQLAQELIQGGQYGIVYPQKGLAPTVIDPQLAETLTAAAPIAKDWNFDSNTETQKIFGEILTNIFSGTDPQQTLDEGAKVITQNIQKAENL